MVHARLQQVEDAVQLNTQLLCALADVRALEREVRGGSGGGGGGWGGLARPARV